MSFAPRTPVMKHGRQYRVEQQDRNDDGERHKTCRAAAPDCHYHAERGSHEHDHHRAGLPRTPPLLRRHRMEPFCQHQVPPKRPVPERGCGDEHPEGESYRDPFRRFHAPSVGPRRVTRQRVESRRRSHESVARCHLIVTLARIAHGCWGLSVSRGPTDRVSRGPARVRRWCQRRGGGGLCRSRRLTLRAAPFSRGGWFFGCR